MHLYVLIKWIIIQWWWIIQGREKNWEWIELDDGFQVNKQVIYTCEYNAKRMKKGKWIIVFWGNNIDGSYDYEKGQKKI
ncbi:unnamed protein product [Paramecium sonneborni]|uniref:Uncharacterized protein n=1 Tax=Paramecium sonneborni TaxID=65129 RepID=A0A8S1RQK2_9CILI|nr:unnamed protein product [Paramecium sonneborni]